MRLTRFIRVWPLAAVAAGALVLAACSMVQSTALTEIGNSLCKSDAGLYYLPKSILKVVMTPEGGDDARKYSVQSVTVSSKPDERQGYCLDFLASPTSNDTLVIQKQQNLLVKITSDAEDQSKLIAENLTKALFVGISGNPNFNPNVSSARSLSKPTLGTSDLNFEFDPLNAPQLALVNDSLKDVGYCLFVNAHSHDVSQREINQYCEAPLARASKEKALKAARADSSKAAHPSIHRVTSTRGILYRVRQPYTLSLFYKYPKSRTVPNVPGDWVLQGSESIFLENASPVFALGVDRTFFTTRTTTLIFESGVLRDVKIRKDSEVAGFVQIPLQIAQGIAALPANIIQVRIWNMDNESRLVIAQEALIKENNELIDKLNLLKATQTPIAEPGGPEEQGQVRSLGAVNPRSLTGSGGNASAWTTSTTATAATTGSKDQCFEECVANDGHAQCRALCTCRVDCEARFDAKSCRQYCARLPNQR